VTGIRGIVRATVEQDTSTGAYVVDATILVRADSAGHALSQLEDAVRQAQQLRDSGGYG
jgi:uncharacterized protein YbaP (TraB family)